MALLRVKWAEAWKCQSNPSSAGEWQATTTKIFWRKKAGPLTGDRENGFDALAADRVVDHAEVLSGVLDHGLADDEGAADLLHSIVQLHQLLVLVGLHELVPPVRIKQKELELKQMCQDNLKGADFMKLYKLENYKLENLILRQAIAEVCSRSVSYKCNYCKNHICWCLWICKVLWYWPQ